MELHCSEQFDVESPEKMKTKLGFNFKKNNENKFLNYRSRISFHDKANKSPYFDC